MNFEIDTSLTIKTAGGRSALYRNMFQSRTETVQNSAGKNVLKMKARDAAEGYTSMYEYFIVVESVTS